MGASNGKILAQEGASFCLPSAADRAAPNTVHWAVNFFPSNAETPNSPWVQRRRFANVGTSGGAGSSVRAVGTLVLSSGSTVFWLFSDSSGIWTLSGTTYTNVVTAANFATAGITLGAASWWVQFGDAIVFSDGTNKPFTWDGGSGAGAIATLTNAPVAFGRPAVYYAKLFLIKASDQRTIVWSEENDPTTGYEAGGFNNAWTLSQTAQATLTGLMGTNNGLYYFRSSSIGVIRGAVNSAFVTTGVHDAVTRSSGISDSMAVIEVDDDLWYVDSTGGLMYLPSGGKPVSVFAGTRAIDFTETGIGTKLYFGSGFSSGSAALFVAPAMTSASTISLTPFRSRTVWLWGTVPSGLTALRAALVFDVEARALLGIVAPYTNAVVSFPFLADSGVPGIVHGSTGRVFRYETETLGPDLDISGNAQATTYQLIGAPLGIGGDIECRFDRLVVTVTGTASNETMEIQALTSRQPTSSTISAAQSVGINSGSSALTWLTKRVGLAQQGRWLRPVFQISSSVTPSSTPYAIQSWGVLGVPLSSQIGAA